METLRDLLRRYPYPAAILGILLIGLGGWRIYRYWTTDPRDPPRQRMEYYYNTQNQALVVKPAGSADSQNVRARVYACGSCAEESKRFVGWLEIAAEELGREAPPRAKKDEHPEAPNYLIRRTTDSQWVWPDSVAGQKIMQRAARKCAKKDAVYCSPPSQPIGF